MNGGNWEVIIQPAPGRFGFNIWILRKSHGGPTEIMRGDVVETIDEGGAVDPTAYFDQDLLQSFAEALDKRGFKPKQGFLEGKLEATEAHLMDMQRIVFKNFS